MNDAILSLRPNRAGLLRFLESYITRARDEGTQLGLLVVQLQRGADLRALFADSEVEAMLEESALRLADICRREDRIIRIGDQEFAMLLPGILNEGHAVLAATRAVRAFAAPFEVGEEREQVSSAVHIGIALFPDHGAVPDLLLRRAETALAEARNRKLPLNLYNEEGSGDLQDSWDIENELERALSEGELELHYQPKIDLTTRLVCGAEALVRWNSPQRGRVAPDTFIPLATRTGQLRRLTWAVINMALEQGASWPTTYGPLSLALNISPTLLDDATLVTRVADAMGLWGTQPGRLILEITESGVMQRPEVSFEAIRHLRAKGVWVSIDDFGTGYSSLANFRSIPANELKIDRSFVTNMVESESDAKIVNIIVRLAKDFGLLTAAEGAEHAGTLAKLAALGCDSAQGYYISPPLPADAFMEFVREFVPPVY